MLRSVHGVEYAGRYRAAGDHERVGGDFYDVRPGADASRETFVVLGDVAGKGLDAAVLAGRTRDTPHALLPPASDHGQVLTLLNGALLTSHHTRFATMVLAGGGAVGEDGRFARALGADAWAPDTRGAAAAPDPRTATPTVRVAGELDDGGG